MFKETIIENQSTADHVTKTITNLLTEQDIQTIANSALGSSSKLVVGFTLKKHGGKNLGFMGAYQNLTITVYNNANNEEEEHSFFVKSIPYGIDSQVSFIEESRAFYKETGFYEHIISELSKQVDNNWSAQCYLVKSDLLVFENLKLKKFEIKNQFLDVVSVKAALSSLAKLHAASILSEKRLGKRLLDLYPEILSDVLFLRGSVNYNWCCAGIKVAVAVAAQLKLDATLLPRLLDQVGQLILPSESMLNAVCHSDPRSTNLLFNDSELVSKCVLVDFQLVRYAPVMTDVSLLLYLATRRQLRDNCETDLLAHYHQALSEQLQGNDEGIAHPPTLKEILGQYEKVRLVGVVTALIYYPIIFMETEESSEPSSKSNDFAEIQLGDRVNLVLDTMQRNSFYKQIITEIIKETIERADQLLALSVK